MLEKTAQKVLNQINHQVILKNLPNVSFGEFLDFRRFYSLNAFTISVNFTGNAVVFILQRKPGIIVNSTTWHDLEVKFSRALPEFVKICKEFELIPLVVCDTKIDLSEPDYIKKMFKQLKSPEGRPPKSLAG